jgi:hypothetical protein
MRRWHLIIIVVKVPQLRLHHHHHNQSVTPNPKSLHVNAKHKPSAQSCFIAFTSRVQLNHDNETSPGGHHGTCENRCRGYNIHLRTQGIGGHSNSLGLSDIRMSKRFKCYVNPRKFQSFHGFKCRSNKRAPAAIIALVMIAAVILT